MQKFLRSLRPDAIPQHVFQKNPLTGSREIIIQSLFNSLLASLTIGSILFMVFSPQISIAGNIWVYPLGYLLFVFVAVNRKLDYYIRASFIVIIFITLGTTALINYGLSGTGMIFLISAILLGKLLFRARVSFLVDIIALGAMIVVGSLMVKGSIPLPAQNVMANSGDSSQWIATIGITILATGPIVMSVLLILRGMTRALMTREGTLKALEDSRATMEQQIEERSADLRRSIARFEVASQITRDIASETNLENLLITAVNQVRDRFGFYHVGIFFNDSKNEFSVLRAATGDAGRMMLERGHRLRIGEIGMVGYVTRQGEARISSNVADDVVHYRNPLLPDTRSEVVLPLRINNQTIGALDVQSTLADAFTVDDVKVLQTIADQLSIAFEKTHLVNELQHTVNELETTSRTNTQKAWRTHLRNTRQALAYRYHDSRLENQAEESEQGQEAMVSGQSVMKIVPGIKDEQGRPITVLAVPIKVRNQVLGVVDIHFEAATISPDLISLIENTVNRLAVSLENARLLEEIQIRAERERMVSEISSKVRAASDVDSVLRTAIQEIGRSLGVSEVAVQLRKES